MANETISGLMEALRTLELKSNEEWMASIEARKVAEARFHDHSHELNEAHDEVYTNSKFYSVAKASDDFYDRWVADHAPGKVVLDYACGNGGGALRAARAGARLAIGLDISRNSIETAKKDAAAENLVNTCFVQGDCEHTGLPDDSVDVVLCAGMLHHIDLTYAFPELRRILRPGGIIIACEALNYNPIIKLYRRLTPELRTEFEVDHIISHREVRFASHFFEVRHITYWHLCTILAVPLRDTGLFKPVLGLLRAVDSVLLRLPLVRNMAWQFTFELVKPSH